MINIFHKLILSSAWPKLRGRKVIAMLEIVFCEFADEAIGLGGERGERFYGVGTPVKSPSILS
jgi:hypothetical protein